MSYQATEWVRKLRGVNSGEKAVLMQIGCHLDQRTNVARVSIAELAIDAAKSERQIIRILKQLQDFRDEHPNGIVRRIGGGNGRRNVAIYSLVGFEAQNVASSQPKRLTFALRKGDIPAEKGDIGDALIRNRRIPKQIQEENHHGCAEMKVWWFRLKEDLKARVGLAEWNRWVRPIFLLKVLSHTHLLLAAPPNKNIHRAYKQHEQWLRQVLSVQGYCCSLTVYPGELELERLVVENDGWREVANRLLSKKLPAGVPA